MKKTKDTVDIERIAHKRLWKPAPSLKPGLTMIEQACRNHPEAVAIRDAWAFKHPVVKLSAEKFAALVAKGTVTFHG
ncbi:hypothetical protein [Terriglobus roseus]|uniref:Uncharacterized protein n=1 Tax=Terriglobus roseus TaxID=392734 RepID=A0A1H4J4A7_9BACT|nr:hypothetical protein [Terriglobus roseus]SEB40905.1 hypothetical protein SAMN05443244_0340 [Terriglobus roseus]